MPDLIKKRAITLILLAITSTIVFLCGGCNNAAPTQATNSKVGIQKDNFNEESAKQQSRAELEKFLKISENKTFIANDSEKQKIEAFVNSKCKGYFTKDFINDTSNELSTKGFGNNYTIFYLASDIAGKVSWYNKYQIYSPTVDKANEIITYELKTNEIGFVPTTYVYIQMKNENGKWKLNKTLY